MAATHRYSSQRFIRRLASSIIIADQFVQPEEGTISHGLATALIDPEGHVINIWRGNAWKSSEVIDELRRQVK
jgi:cytochrome oxidase Cu insertion factor (SCO1/SenC/PrrC family)